MAREEIVPERLADATAVVVDVFLATTTLLTILENGARRVFPVASLEEAEEVGAKLDASGVLRGGEQDAARIEGYDHGPFPDEYPRDCRRRPSGESSPRLPPQRTGRSPLSRKLGCRVGLPDLRRLRRTLHHRRLPRRGHRSLSHEHRGMAAERRRVDGARLHETL
jgi:hypothetical protein